jgi:hypothetical protein
MGIAVEQCALSGNVPECLFPTDQITGQRLSFGRNWPEAE